MPTPPLLIRFANSLTLRRAARAAPAGVAFRLCRCKVPRPRRCSDEHFLVKPFGGGLVRCISPCPCGAQVAFRLCRCKVPRPRRCSRVTTRATVGREESLSASSPQRPICSRRRPYIPAAVPAQWLRLMVFRQARYCRHFTCRRRLPLAARLTFLSRETVWAVLAVRWWQITR